MQVNGVNSTNFIKAYGEAKKITEKKPVENKKDSLEISSAGKNLSVYSVDEAYVNSEEKIEGLRTQVANGTYNSNARLTAQKMIDVIKGRSV